MFGPLVRRVPSFAAALDYLLCRTTALVEALPSHNRSIASGLGMRRGM